MFDIVHKLFSRPVCGGGRVSVGWIGLSEAEVRPALLIISWTKYRVPAWKRGQWEKKTDEGMRPLEFESCGC